MPTTPSPPANTSLTTPPAEQPMSRPGGTIFNFSYYFILYY
jgi:hypothetical protein